MKTTILSAAALALTLACGDQRSLPVGIGRDGGSLTGPAARLRAGETFLGAPIARHAIPIEVLGTEMRLLDGGDVQRLLKEGRLTEEDIRLEGGACPVLMDCWWVDPQEHQTDVLWENYILGGPAGAVGVLLFKVGNTPGDPCPTPPTALTIRFAFTQCVNGKPRPVLVTPVSVVPFGGGPLLKGTYIISVLLAPLPPGVYDSFFVMDWDGAAPIYDDACGLDVWGPQSGDGAPLRIMSIFGPEPPHPPGGWPPGRLAGEDAETRPWCVSF